MPYKIFLIQLFFLFFGSIFLLGSTFPHMGRVISNGKPFEGEGHFWFVWLMIPTKRYGIMRVVQAFLTSLKNSGSKRILSNWAGRS